jgi:outer membrane protein assembly factor BamB
MDSHPGLSGMVNSLKKNEIDALSGYADYYIELIIINSQNSASEYELKARMIDTKTGEIIARVTSSSSSTPGSGGYTGSKNGYSNTRKPGISSIANYLAEELIIKINHAWSF